MDTRMTHEIEALPSDDVPPGWYPIEDRVLGYWDGAQWTADKHRTWTPIEGVGPQLPPLHPAAVISLVLALASILPILSYLALGGWLVGKQALEHCEPQGPWGGRRLAETAVLLSKIILIFLAVAVVIAIAFMTAWMISLRGGGG